MEGLISNPTTFSRTTTPGQDRPPTASCEGAIQLIAESSQHNYVKIHSFLCVLASLREATDAVVLISRQAAKLAKKQNNFNS
jgi:hypothetical protein